MSNWKDDLRELVDQEGGRPKQYPATRTIVERDRDFDEKVVVPALRQIGDTFSQDGDVEVTEGGRQGAYLRVVFEPTKIRLYYYVGTKPVWPLMHVDSLILIDALRHHNLKKRKRLTRLPVEEPAAVISIQDIIQDFSKQYGRLMRAWRGETGGLPSTHG